MSLKIVSLLLVFFALLIFGLIVPIYLIGTNAGLRSELQDVKKELESSKIMLMAEKNDSDKIWSDALGCTRASETVKVYRAEVVTYPGWKSVPIVSRNGYVLATVLYQVLEFNKETRHYDFKIADEDMVKRPDTYFRVCGIAMPEEEIHSECIVEGKYGTGVPYHEITKGELLKLFSRPFLYPYQSPWIITANDVVKAVVEQESR